MPQEKHSPCICEPFHRSCDPATCDSASFSKSSISPAEEFNTHIKGIQVTFTKRELDDTAQAGCKFCQILLTVLMNNPELSGRAWGSKEEILKVTLRDNSLKLKIIRTGDSIEYLETSGLALPTACKAIPVGSFEPLGTLNDSAFTLCNTWISNCVKNHRSCKAIQPKLPRRVIDIGYTGQDSFSPRLYESNNESTPYAALSHCWGPNPIITTTTSTLSSRKQYILWASLAKTFQDALIITQRLGLRYIWIDSLCIIQDDLLDWETESKKMASIYEGSMITIAAAASKDGNGGCFINGPSVHTIVQPGRRGDEVSARKCPRHDGFEDESWFHTTNNLPLFSRAWTFQEELLATRVLYFCSDEIVFQCKSSISCQCGGISSYLEEEKKYTTKKQYQDALLEYGEPQYQWSRIVKQYSARYLTKESDRLPALSGLTGIFRNKGLDEFVAGMWTKALPLWLTWEVYGSQVSPDPAVYVAPSWSWVQIVSGNQIEYAHCGWRKHGNSPKLDIKLSIVDVHCELAGTDPSGTIKSGYIDVLGPVVEATLIYNFPPLLGQRGSLVTLPPFSLRRGDLQTDFTCDCQDRVWMNAKEGQDVVLLLVYVDGEKCCFLVLMEKLTGEYVRIGIAVREDVRQIGGDGRELPIWDVWFRDAEAREIKIV